VKATGSGSGGRATPDNAAEDLKALQDDLAADADRLAAIEREKAGLDPSDPRHQELSDEAERLARWIHPKTVAEVQLSDEAARQG
jgi:hypothetical protein